MPRTITGKFAVRREAELAVEHLVQELGIDRSAVEVTTDTSENTAGVVAAGADTDPATGDPDASARHGGIAVSVTADEAVADKVQAAMWQAGGR